MNFLVKVSAGNSVEKIIFGRKRRSVGWNDNKSLSIKHNGFFYMYSKAWGVDLRIYTGFNRSRRR